MVPRPGLHCSAIDGYQRMSHHACALKQPERQDRTFDSATAYVMFQLVVCELDSCELVLFFVATVVTASPVISAYTFELFSYCFVFYILCCEHSLLLRRGECDHLLM